MGKAKRLPKPGVNGPTSEAALSRRLQRAELERRRLEAERKGRGSRR